MSNYAKLLATVGLLNHRHCFVLRTNAATAIPVIEIANPYPSLKAKAVAVTEMRHGTLNKMYVARVGGCLVRWWSGECQQYVGRAVVNSQEDEHEKRRFLSSIQACKEQFCGYFETQF